MRETVESLDNQFADLHIRLVELTSRLSSDFLYASPQSDPKNSCGEQILRSAATVEQSFGGLIANLWDDPFEWTLPETLNTPSRIVEYLNEVEATRRRGFEALKIDDDLAKEIMTPSGPVRLQAFLLDTLERARHHLQRAIEALELLKTED